MPTSTATSVASAHQCPSCGAHADRRYCAECGQRQHENRHTLRSLAAGALDRAFNLEAGFLHTIYKLSMQPHTVIIGYLSGQTAPYTHPVAYLLIAFAAFAVSAKVLGGFRGGGDVERIAALLLVPCVAAASRVVFLRARFNYAEHLILVMYAFAHATLCYAVVQVVFPLLGRSGAISLAVVVLAACLAYFLWVYAGLFRARVVLSAVGGLAALAGGGLLWVVVILSLLRVLR